MFDATGYSGKKWVTVNSGVVKLPNRCLYGLPAPAAIWQLFSVFPAVWSAILFRWRKPCLSAEAAISDFTVEITNVGHFFAYLPQTFSNFFILGIFIRIHLGWIASHFLKTIRANKFAALYIFLQSGA